MNNYPQVQHRDNTVQVPLFSYGTGHTAVDNTASRKEIPIVTTQHGDKKKAVTAALKNPLWSQFPNTEIARRCFCDESYVRRMKAKAKKSTPAAMQWSSYHRKPPRKEGTYIVLLSADCPSGVRMATAWWSKRGWLLLPEVERGFVEFWTPLPQRMIDRPDTVH